MKTDTQTLNIFSESPPNPTNMLRINVYNNSLFTITGVSAFNWTHLTPMCRRLL